MADIVVGPSQDRIFLEGMEFHGYIGVHALEKCMDSHLFDVALFCPCLEACESDRLVDTLIMARFLLEFVRRWKLRNAI